MRDRPSSMQRWLSPRRTAPRIFVGKLSGLRGTNVDMRDLFEVLARVHDAEISARAQSRPCGTARFYTKGGVSRPDACRSVALPAVRSSELRPLVALPPVRSGELRPSALVADMPSHPRQAVPSLA